MLLHDLRLFNFENHSYTSGMLSQDDHYNPNLWPSPIHWQLINESRPSSFDPPFDHAALKKKLVSLGSREPSPVLDKRCSYHPPPCWDSYVKTSLSDRTTAKQLAEQALGEPRRYREPQSRDPSRNSGHTRSEALLKYEGSALNEPHQHQESQPPASYSNLLHSPGVITKQAAHTNFRESLRASHGQTNIESSWQSDPDGTNLRYVGRSAERNSKAKSTSSTTSKHGLADSSSLTNRHTETEPLPPDTSPPPTPMLFKGGRYLPPRPLNPDVLEKNDTLNQPHTSTPKLGGSNNQIHYCKPIKFCRPQPLELFDMGKMYREASMILNSSEVRDIAVQCFSQTYEDFLRFYKEIEDRFEKKLRERPPSTRERETRHRHTPLDYQRTLTPQSSGSFSYPLNPVSVTPYGPDKRLPTTVRDTKPEVDYSLNRRQHIGNVTPQLPGHFPDPNLPDSVLSQCHRLPSSEDHGSKNPYTSPKLVIDCSQTPNYSSNHLPSVLKPSFGLDESFSSAAHRDSQDDFQAFNPERLQTITPQPPGHFPNPRKPLFKAPSDDGSNYSYYIGLAESSSGRTSIFQCSSATPNDRINNNDPPKSQTIEAAYSRRADLTIPPTCYVAFRCLYIVENTLHQMDVLGVTGLNRLEDGLLKMQECLRMQRILTHDQWKGRTDIWDECYQRWILRVEA
ncbi:hypothetical protein H0H87_001098 [Tephrocybe sp. NHM501043]|nr:hypothetical protein H0H87_001098 [Tephrocybe sp. NHM501043]